MLYLHVIPNIPNDFHISIMELWSYQGFDNQKSRSPREKIYAERLDLLGLSMGLKQ